METFEEKNFNEFGGCMATHKIFVNLISAIALVLNSWKFSHMQSCF